MIFGVMELLESLPGQATLNVLHWIFTIFMIIPVLRGLVKTKNRYDRAFAAILINYAIALQFIFYTATADLLGVEIALIGRLPIFLILTMILMGEYLFYFAHLYDYNRWLLIVAFTTLVEIKLGIALTGKAWEGSLFGLLLVGTFVLVLIISFAFVKRGLKNRDGLIFAFGVFTFTTAMNLNFIMGSYNMVVFELIGLFSMLFLMLGTTGWIDYNIFYDRKEQEKIKNTWAAKIVVAKKKKVVKKDAVVKSKAIRMVCPICQAGIRKGFSVEQVQERINNPKGLVKVLI